MNITCVICSDILCPTAEVYATQCGHMFHYVCLVNWLERSKTCPQCRNQTTERKIHRVYFNVANTDNIQDDVGTLQGKLDTLQLQYSLKSKDVTLVTEKYHKAKKKNAALRLEVADLESRLKGCDSAILALKEQCSFFKSKAKDNQKLVDEIAQLKQTIKNMENVDIAINGTREQVNEILRNENNLEALALLSATLKKTLLDTERKHRESHGKLRTAKNEATAYKRELKALEVSHSELKLQHHQLKKSSEDEKAQLKQKIIELKEKLKNNELNCTDTSRIIFESPMPSSLKNTKNSDESSTPPVKSPTVAEKVEHILDSDSPYLNVKSALPGLLCKFSTKNTKDTIFKNSSAKILDNAKLSNVKRDDVVYNGLGGHSQEHKYPDGNHRNTHCSSLGSLKRPKSTSSISTNKFRKLAPFNKKITTYLNDSP